MCLANPLQTRWWRRKFFILIGAAYSNVDAVAWVPELPSLLHNDFAPIACEKRGWMKWRQQVRDVEEVRRGKELRRCENVPDQACRCRAHFKHS
jgi:hypothetical protein